MKISDTLEPRLRETFESDHERTLRRLTKNKHNITIPIHTANMRMLNTNSRNDGDSIRRTIIPDMVISINPSSVTNEGIKKYGIMYTLAQNQKAFPLAHVYNGGGSLCLGSIFVPSFIPKHSPQQPLETLFLHNDRHVAHGQPKLPVTLDQRKQLVDIVYNLDNQFPVNINHDNWVKQDTLWRIGEYMLDHYSKEQAFKIMKDIFMILFETDKT